MYWYGQRHFIRRFVFDHIGEAWQQLEEHAHWTMTAVAGGHTLV